MMRKSVGIFVWITVCVFTSTPYPIASHAQTERAAHPYQVFVQNSDGEDELRFIDMLTGEESRAQADGTTYTALPDGILYWDGATSTARLVTPDGRDRAFRLIDAPEEVRRVDWAVSGDGTMLAWTITEGNPGALRTTTSVANISGGAQNAVTGDVQVVFTDSAQEGIRAFPVAFNAEKTVLYMDYQPDTIADFTPFRQYAALFALDLATSTRESLPGEAGCYCGGGIGAGKFLRLVLAAGGGFDLRITDLETGAQDTLPLSGANDYAQSGDLLIAPDGTRAIYALAQVRGFGTATQSLETRFVLVDLEAMTQTPIAQGMLERLRPIAWTDDNSAILLIDPDRNGTWKWTLGADESPILQIAEGNYIGTITPSGGA